MSSRILWVILPSLWSCGSYMVQAISDESSQDDCPLCCELRVDCNEGIEIFVSSFCNVNIDPLAFAFCVDQNLFSWRVFQVHHGSVVG